jgi:hypothetical protein
MSSIHLLGRAGRPAPVPEAIAAVSHVDRSLLFISRGNLGTEIAVSGGKTVIEVGNKEEEGESVGWKSVNLLQALVALSHLFRQPLFH